MHQNVYLFSEYFKCVLYIPWKKYPISGLCMEYVITNSKLYLTL